ncbi:hypothetical protein FRC18_005676 [Serendipita sp. 400]|nr:hypothetical protein FRC18_005676 [Serendipita sp. 400]
MQRFWSSFVSFWSSRHDHRIDRYYPILPPELWKSIIDSIIDEIRHPYRYCRPATFPQYHARFSLADKLENDTTLEDWKSIRSVCWAWKQFAGPQPYLHLRHFQQDAPNEDTLKGISSILIGNQLEGYTVLNTLAQYPAICRNLTTLVFGEDNYYRTLDILFDNSSSFSSLRCLSINNTVCHRQFWQAIQDKYPRLISLTIHQYSGGLVGNYTLKYLEILALPMWGDFQLSCPSLRHLAVRHGRTEQVMEFLIEHGNQLESLILGGSILSAVASHSENAWTMLPNLRTLGRLAYIPFPVPPADHPLRHLRILAHRRSLDIEYVLKTLESHPGITHIHIQSKALKSGSMKAFRARCLEHNVMVIEVSDQKPIPSTRSPFYEVWLVNGLVALFFLHFLISYPFKKLSRAR